MAKSDEDTLRAVEEENYWRFDDPSVGESADDVLRAIKGKGYWRFDDPDVGKDADVVLKERFKIQTVEGIKLFKATTFDNAQIRAVIGKALDKPVAVFYRGFGQTKRIHCFRNNVVDNITPNISLLGICLCSTDTELAAYERTHLCRLDATYGLNGVLAVSDERIDDLIKLGEIAKVEEKLKYGGYILHDGRLGWKVLKGKVAFIGIAIPTVAAKYTAKMPLTGTDDFVDIVDIVEDMKRKSEAFCAHFMIDAQN